MLIKLNLNNTICMAIRIVIFKAFVRHLVRAINFVISNYDPST